MGAEGHLALERRDPSARRGPLSPGRADQAAEGERAPLEARAAGAVGVRALSSRLSPSGESGPWHRPRLPSHRPQLSASRGPGCPRSGEARGWPGSLPGLRGYRKLNVLGPPSRFRPAKPVLTFPSPRHPPPLPVPMNYPPGGPREQTETRQHSRGEPTEAASGHCG